MPPKQNTKQAKAVVAEPKSSIHTTYQLRLYYVRIHDEKEKLDVHAVFGDNITFHFQTIKQLEYDRICSPFIYILNLTLIIDDSGKLLVRHENTWKPIGQYGLEISRRVLLKTMTYTEERNPERHLSLYLNDKHNFLFDIHFAPKFGLHLPGLDPTVFTSLCSFTYHLLCEEQYDTFNILANQFTILLSHNQYSLKESDFIDFFEKCHRYFSDIPLKSHTELTIVTIILRMVGLLPIEKTSFARYNHFSHSFANRILPCVRSEFDKIYQLVDETEYTLFKRGLTTLLCIELLQNRADDYKSDKLSFLNKISDKKRRQDLSYKLLLKLFKLEHIIIGDTNWTDLFLMVPPKTIVINHLELTNSFETFYVCISKISRVLSDDDVFKNQISNFFEDRVFKDLLQVDLQSILYLMNSLEQEPPDEPRLTKEYLTIVQSTIKSSSALKLKIKEYFDKLKTNATNMEEVQTIIDSIDKYTMLSYVNKFEYLKKSLANLSTADEYIKWFQCFLAKSRIGYSEKRMNYEELLESWIDSVNTNYMDLTQVMMKVDVLLDAFDQSDDSNQFRLHCINLIIDLCFKQKPIYNMIVDGLLGVQDKLFREEFKTTFHKEYVSSKPPSTFKDIYNENNPLLKLIAVDRIANGNSLLVRALIELICDQIKMIDKDELLRETFLCPEEPSLTSIVLFENAFEALPIRKTLVEQLKVLWNEWETNGFQLERINNWTELKLSQKKIACQIWNFIGENNGKTIRFEQWIGEAERKIQEILQVKEAVTMCLNNHCENACDKNRYFSHLNDLQQQVDRATVSSAKVHPDIELLQPFSKVLNPIFPSRAWQYHLKQSIESKKCDENINDDRQERTCLDILKEITEIRIQFINRLEGLCTETDQALHPQLEQLFLEKYLINYELDILKPLLNGNIAVQLELLLSYWKNRDHMFNIWKGCIHMMEEYLPTSDKLLVLQNIMTFDNKTSSETCIAAYQDYCAHFSNKYSERTLELIAQWSVSHELLKYVYSLKTTDVDDLLEVVNDWDESLINTKTVLDFVLLKRFLDKVNVEIEIVKAQRSLKLDEIIVIYEKILKQNEFQNLLVNFAACLKSLTSIQRISTGAANKEQSKRKRILDIMTQSDFCFCAHRAKGLGNAMEYQFDIHIRNNNWEPVLFDDLSDLRDRARLIQYASSNSNNVQNYTETDIQKLQSFVSLVDKIEMIIQTLTALYIAGYPVMREYPMSKRKFACNEGNHDELEKFRKTLAMQLVDWEKQLCAKYKECLNLTYFSYQQISMIEDALHKQTATMPNTSVYHLLKFVGIDPQLIQLNLLPDRSKTPFELLKTVVNVVQTEQDRSYTSIQEETDQVQEKVSVVATTNKDMLRAILSLFYLNNISPPIANQLFYCTKYTGWVEIRAFIYRCFYSQTLHQLIRPELLSIVIQDQFVQLLNRLMEQFPNQFFRLGIITTVSPDHLPLVSSFRTSRILKILSDQDLLDVNNLGKTIQELIGDHCMLVTSKITGLGKSTYIRNEIRQLEKTQIKFPISGDMDIDTLMERLRDQKIQSAPSTVALHINIGPVENVQQLNEFLYCLVLFRCFRFGHIPVVVPNNIPIYIELDSSLHLFSLQDDIIIFKYLNTKYFERLEWNELDVTSNNIQLVANYLQAIEDNKINEKDIHEETITTLDQSVCISLLEKYFLPKKNLEFISWTQLSIFLSVYYKLFIGFSKCGYFIVDSKVKSSLRSDILNSLLNSSDKFTSLSVETVRKNQRAISGNENVLPLNETIIRWDESQPFTLIFTTAHEPLFVYKARADIPPSLENAFRSNYELISDNTTQTTTNTSIKRYFSLFRKSSSTETSSSVKTVEQHLKEFLVNPNEMTHEQFFLRLTSLSKKYFMRKSVCEKCFSQFDYDEQCCISCPTKNFLIRPDSINDQDIINFQKKMAEKLQSQYVLTADNYVKMLLIYLRVQSNLPVLIMGETGCGKTALIHCLCRKILDDDMEVFHIHAGVTNEKIIETMHGYIKQAQKLLEIKPDKRVWIFFDEFNTTPNIGLLKEIVCERTLLGEPLPDNMVFLGACNPQRRKAKKEESVEQFGIKKYHSDIQRQIHVTQSSLLYSVVSIPETMLEHVWDYGFLDETTEKKYIEKILDACMGIKTNNNWFICTVNLISESQKYFRLHNDVSSVSLRDAIRFCRFYNWFYKFSIPSENQQAFTLYPFEPIERASLLALFLCYYFRLDSSTKRNNYMTSIVSFVQKSKPEFSLEFLTALLENEKKALVDRMEIPPGTAKNGALTDNIFVLFTCILNRIPVILCGEPGSSKTSAVQIIISSLKGKRSEDPFFSQKPELVAVSYQGSQNCTSENILKVFERADKFADAKSEIQLLPVIVFDEIGLAELSPHNPLKVLHSQLEIETCRHGFVGLSNWRLDASKMNRAVYLSCLEPDLEDLKLTAKSLSESMLPKGGQAIPLDQRIIEGLAVAYMKICEHMKKQTNKHYFGLRDYYSLIKGIMHDTIQKDYKEKYLYKIIRDQFACNFDDLINGSKLIWSKFCEHMHEEYKISQYSPPTFDQLLNQCLSSRNGRFLMLIGDSESTFDYVQRYITIKHSAIQTRSLIGSTFSGDFLSNTTYTEQYNIRVLMDIILDVERNVTLFLRGLGHLYDNLYDLFNQSFAVSAKKKYCRIALGSLYHPRCVIHDEFYCVVFVKKQDLHKYDLPFLNRFEKHQIDRDSLLNEHHKNIALQLNQWINQMISMKTSTNFPLKKHLFPEFSDNYTLNLVTDALNHLQQSNGSVNDQDVLTYCQNQLFRMSSFDLPLLLSLESKVNHKQLIEQYYQTHNDLTFASFINEEFEQKKNTKLLIYTYTQIYHTIDYNDITNHQEWIEEIKLSYFKTELELIQKLKLHYQSESIRLLCIRVDYQRDYQHIPILKHILINEQVNDASRGICLIFHLQRCELGQTNDDVFFYGWSRVMIDDLQTHQLIPEPILTNPSYADLITHLNFLNMETTFDELINRCIIQFHYVITNKNCEIDINKRRNRIIEQLTSYSTKTGNANKPLRSLVKNCLLQFIQNIVCDPNQTEFNDWRQDLLSNGITIGSSRSFNDALIKTISLYLDRYLSLLFFYLERNSLIDSYLFLIDSKDQIRAKLHPLWDDFWTTTIQKIDPSVINQNYIETPLVYNLHLPCATREYEIISQIRQIVAQSRQNDDKHLMDLAYSQLISKSFYGSFIDKIFQDSDIFTHYYHDQLTLTENEANIHHLPTFVIQCLTSKISDDVKYQLTYLLVYHEELFEIMRLFEIGLTMIDEKCLIGIINEQYIVCNDNNEDTIKNITNFYLLVQGKENIYLIPPQSPLNDQCIYEGEADPFMEISLMNLIELLISQPFIDRVNDIENLILVFSLFSQSMNKLSRYGRHIVVNFEKFNSFLCLTSCISALFSSDEALIILKEIRRYSDNCFELKTLDDIHRFVTYLRNVIDQKESTASNTIINQTLLKFENELLRNWSFDNSSKCSDILNFINDNDLWRYSAKIFNFIDKNLDISATIKKTDEQGSQHNENEEVEEVEANDEDDEALNFPNDPTRKIEILMSMEIYTQLVLNENYQSQIIDKSNYEILSVLKQNFNHFKNNIYEVNDKQDDHTLQFVGLIAWLKYYLLHYAYALKKDSKHDIMTDIDRFLVEYSSALCLTIKLYVIKLLCYSENITLTQLYEKYINRNTVWMRLMIDRSSYQRPPNARRDVILPTPLFEFADEFKNIDEKLSAPITANEIRGLIRQCSGKQNTTYCFIMWFLHYYTRFCMGNVLPHDSFVRVVEFEVAKELGEWLEPIGHKQVYSLCKNFDEKSYFRLDAAMTEEDRHQRLLILNIVVVLISFRSIKKPSFLNSLLFDKNFKMPNNYTEHFNQLSDITGITLANNPAVIQMIYIRTQIDKQPDLNMNIFQCSSQCSWIFYIENSIVSNEHKQCPLCKKVTSISSNGELLVTNKSHIPMTKNETVEFINTYIEEHKLKDPLHNVEKPDYLSQPLTYHFMDLLTHAVFLFLYELDYMPCSTSIIRSYFQKSVRTKFALLQKTLCNVDQSYIWLYKLINHMVNASLPVENGLHSGEQLIEEQLIIPHTYSIVHEIREYQSAYADFVYGQDKNNQLVTFVDELIEDNNKYPLLNFFNVSNIHSIDLIDHFYSQLQLQPNYENKYPVTNFVLKRLSDYDNIQYLYPLIRFINYLMQQFDHRIKRADANKKTIADCLKNDSNLKSIFDEFLDAWCKISLEEVSFDQKKYKLQPAQSEYNFENKTNISMFLLNKSNDNENMIPAACLQTISHFQNTILDYFHSNVLKHTEKHDYRIIPIQSIHQKHLFDFGIDKLRKLLVEKGFIINSSYGMSQEIIYDYDEIEWTLRSEISCLPKIDVKSIRYINYQGELYDENISLINEIRVRFPQNLLEDQKRAEIKRFMDYLDKNSILELSNSLEYILTYLRTINNRNIVEKSTIQTFIDGYIQSKTYLSNVLSQPLFSSLSLKYIIDLHELIEEYVFDSILRMNIRSELREKSFSIEQQTSISTQIINMIFNDENLADCFKDLNVWINMFKRLLVRLLLTKVNINFDSFLHPYVRRSDMWKGNIIVDDLRTIEIKDNILLKHAFIILKGLEAKMNEKTSMRNEHGLINNEIEQQSGRSKTQPTTSVAKANTTLQKKKAPLKRNDFR